MPNVFQPPVVLGIKLVLLAFLAIIAAVWLTFYKALPAPSVARDAVGPRLPPARSARAPSRSPAHDRLLDVSPIKLTRRNFLKLGAAAAALASASCTRPREPIVPYAHQPEAELPGIPRFYATAASFVGAAEGLLVESNSGRPTKVEGNPAHPGSLGATSVHGQAAVLQLWDPDRSQAPRRRSQPATRSQFELELNGALTGLAARRGEGLRLLLGSCTSPS